MANLRRFTPDSTHQATQNSGSLQAPASRDQQTLLISHSLDFAVGAPYIAVCARCDRRLKRLADVAGLCPAEPGPTDPAHSVTREDRNR